MRLPFLCLGFKLDCQLHQVIVARFADEQLIIDFDNFVRCLIRLETLFSEYHITSKCNVHLDLQPKTICCYLVRCFSPVLIPSAQASLFLYSRVHCNVSHNSFL